MKIFISYSSQNRAAVKALVADLISLEHDVWFDQELSGGQVWWDTILSQIRACDLCIFAVTGHAIRSGPCKLEYTYAYELNKPILPVLLSEDVTITLLPVILQERQFVNYINQDKAALLALNNAIRNTPPAPPLPQVLPDPPDAPISPLAALQAEIEQPELSYDEQVGLFHRIKDHIDDPETHDAALLLMQELEQHPALLAAVFKEINTYLSTVTPGRVPRVEPQHDVPAAPPPDQPPPAGLAAISVRRVSSWGARMREYGVRIDGQKVGSVGNDQILTFDVTPGPHSVHVQVDWIKSDVQTVDLAPGETVHLVTKWQHGALGGKLLLERD